MLVDTEIPFQKSATIRDFFAAAALTGFLAAYSGNDVAFPNCDNLALMAYDAAEAMLAERGKRL